MPRLPRSTSSLRHSERRKRFRVLEHRYLEQVGNNYQVIWNTKMSRLGFEIYVVIIR